MKTARLIDYFPNWITDGIFVRLGDWTPWAEDPDIDPAVLDIEYFGNRSGFKAPSPLLQKLAPVVYDTEAGCLQRELTEVQRQRLISVIRMKYALSWQKLWEAFNAEYDPLDSFTYKETFSGTDARNGSRASKGRSTVTTTNTDSVAPLGSTGYTGITQQSGSTTSEGLQADNGETSTESGTTAHTITRSGSSGSATPQSQIQAEIDLRRKQFFDIIMTDVDSILTIPYWGNMI